PAAFRPPASASWASFPAQGFRPPYGRPTTPPAAARTQTRFPCSARVRPSWLRVPSLPRGQRCPHSRQFSRPPPAASQRPAPVIPDHNPPRDASLTRHQPASFDVLTHDVRPHVARTG